MRGDFQSRIGDQDWELASAPQMTKTAHPKGWLYTCAIAQALPEGFYQYKYLVTFENDTTRWCGDPCTRYGGADEHENAGFVIGGNNTSVNPIPWRLPPKDLILYELMIDDFTSEFRGTRAPIDAVKDRLDYLESLGVNGIEFMPWTWSAASPRRRPHRQGDVHRILQTKFAASFVLPTPVCCATCG